MQIFTGSVVNDAPRVDYVLSNVILPVEASCSSSLSTKSVVSTANGFQIRSSCKSLIS
jgi:hypothetical protein